MNNYKEKSLSEFHFYTKRIKMLKNELQKLTNAGAVKFVI